MVVTKNPALAGAGHLKSKFRFELVANNAAGEEDKKRNTI